MLVDDLPQSAGRLHNLEAIALAELNELCPLFKNEHAPLAFRAVEFLTNPVRGQIHAIESQRKFLDKFNAHANRQVCTAMNAVKGDLPLSGRHATRIAFGEVHKVVLGQERNLCLQIFITA
jgi:hypothetical protein